MADILIKYRFQHTQYSNKNLNAKEKKHTVNTEKAFNYCDRDEACDKTIVQTDKAFNYADYRLGSAGSITNGGKPIDAKRMQIMCDRYKPDVLYGMIISFDRKFAVENQIIDKKNMNMLIAKSMDSILKKMNLDPKNVIWTSSYHTNTDNPHCHINFYEKKKSKKTGKLSRSQMKHLRSVIARELQINTLLFVRRDESMKKLLNSLKEIGLSRDMQFNVESMIQRSSKFSKEYKTVLKKIEELDEVLPRTGSMKYNSKNIRPFHNQIRDIINDLYSLQEIRPFIDEYKNILMETKTLQEKLYGTGDIYYQNGNEEWTKGVGEGKQRQNEYYRKKMYELETRVANMILQTILNGRKDCDEIAKENKELNSLINKKTKYENTYSKMKNQNIEASKPAKAACSIKKISKKKIRNDVYKKRTTLICHGTVNELSNAIQTAFYANVEQKQKIQEAIRNAQNEAYAKQMY